MKKIALGMLVGSMSLVMAGGSGPTSEFKCSGSSSTENDNDDIVYTCKATATSSYLPGPSGDTATYSVGSSQCGTITVDVASPSSVGNACGGDLVSGNAPAE